MDEGFEVVYSSSLQEPLDQSVSSDAPINIIFDFVYLFASYWLC